MPAPTPTVTPNPRPSPESTPTPTPTPTATLPPIVTLTSIEGSTVKLGTGRKAKKAMALVLQFSGALNPTAAQNPAAYSLLAGTVKKHAVTFGKPVPLASAMYSPSAMTVTLVPQGSRKLPKYEQLTIASGQLTDTLGQPIDGGHNLVATLSKSGLVISASDVSCSRNPRTGPHRIPLRLEHRAAIRPARWTKTIIRSTPSRPSGPSTRPNAFCFRSRAAIDVASLFCPIASPEPRSRRTANAGPRCFGPLGTRFVRPGPPVGASMRHVRFAECIRVLTRYDTSSKVVPGLVGTCVSGQMPFLRSLTHDVLHQYPGWSGLVESSVRVSSRQGASRSTRPAPVN